MLLNCITKVFNNKPHKYSVTNRSTRITKCHWENSHTLSNHSALISMGCITLPYIPCYQSIRYIICDRFCCPILIQLLGVTCTNLLGVCLIVKVWEERYMTEYVQYQGPLVELWVAAVHIDWKGCVKQDSPELHLLKKKKWNKIVGWTEYCGNYIFWWNCFFYKNGNLSIIQIVTNFYNSSLNGFKDIWHWKYVVSQGPLFFNAILLYLDLQQCCVEHFSKTRKYLNAILLYLDLQQCCVEHFSKIKKILKCNTVVPRDTTVLHWTFSLYQKNYAMQNCCIFTCNRVALISM